MFADHRVGYLEQGYLWGQTDCEAQSPRDGEIEQLQSGIRHVEGGWDGGGFLDQKGDFLEGGGSVNF